MQDFTMAKYGELCRVLLGAGYDSKIIAIGNAMRIRSQAMLRPYENGDRYNLGPQA